MEMALVASESVAVDPVILPFASIPMIHVLYDSILRARPEGSLEGNASYRISETTNAARPMIRAIHERADTQLR
jgi:hypothetical protein